MRISEKMNVLAFLSVFESTCSCQFISIVLVCDNGGTEVMMAKYKYFIPNQYDGVCEYVFLLRCAPSIGRAR